MRLRRRRGEGTKGIRPTQGLYIQLLSGVASGRFKNHESAGRIVIVLIENIKKLARRSRTIVKLYLRISLLAHIIVNDSFKIHKIKLILAVKPYTMLRYRRLSKLYEIASRLEREKISGSFVECGVWNGGSAGVIAKCGKSRHIWLFDSWEGMPEPTEIDISVLGEPGEKGIAIGLEQKVREILFEKLKLNNKSIHLIKGWFDETIPMHKKDVGRIALLHLDCDWYESVRFCLEELYDSIIEGGFIVIDDYGAWRGCKTAVDEFFDRRNLKIELVKIDWTGVYFQK